MFKFKNKTIRILEKRYNYDTNRDFIHSLSHSELHRLGKEIIWKNFDGYNYNSCHNKEMWFNNCDRWQKEFFVYDHFYSLL